MLTTLHNSIPLVTETTDSVSDCGNHEANPWFHIRRQYKALIAVFDGNK